MANDASFYERETGVITFSFKDPNGNVLKVADIDLLIVTIHWDNDAGTRRYIRSSDDVLADPGFSIDSEGLVTWDVQSFETRFEDESASDDLDDTQDKRVTFELVYYSPQAGMLTDPFATTTDSRDVTVTHPNHDLSVGDDVSFNAPLAVGGIDFAGRYIVETVVSPDQYIIRSLAAATSDDTGGGDVPWFHGGKYRPDVASLEVTRVDPVG